jgi:hypothetical protein
MVLVLLVLATLYAITIDVRPVDACTFQSEPAPVDGMSFGPDCAWRFPDGKTFDEAFPQRIDFPLYFLVPLLLAISITMMVPRRAWKPLSKRLIHEAGRTLKYFTPGNPAGG